MAKKEDGKDVFDTALDDGNDEVVSDDVLLKAKDFLVAAGVPAAVIAGIVGNRKAIRLIGKLTRQKKPFPRSNLEEAFGFATPAATAGIAGAGYGTIDREQRRRRKK